MRYLLLTLLLSATILSAQTTQTFVILTEQQRQGTLTSSSVGPVQTSATRVHIVAVMPQSVRDDPDARLRWIIWKSFDGVNWRHEAGCSPDNSLDYCWTGGSGFVDKQGNVNPPPAFTWEGQSLANIQGALVRAELDIPKRVRLGVNAEVTQ